MEEEEESNPITRPIPCGHHSMKSKNYCDNNKCSMNDYTYKNVMMYIMVNVGLRVNLRLL